MRHARALVLAVTLTSLACSSNYHPEYHPVTVSNFSQNIAYPLSVNGAAPAQPAVVILPSPQTGAVLAPSPAPEGPPPDFFR
jgi:hypothetical protein